MTLIANLLQEADKTEQATDWVDKARTYGVEYGLQILIGIVVFLVGRMIARSIVKLTRNLMAKRGVEPTLAGFACNMLSGILMTLVVITALGQVGVEVTSFIAVLGAATLAIGFALQGSLGNFAAGVMIMVFRPFKVGDFVEGGGATGVVEEIGLFATIMRTGDNKQIIVPNSSMTGGNITNYSSKPTRRVDMVFGIGYDDDLLAAKKELEAILAADERILADPAPVVAVSELGDSSVNFIVRPWVSSADYWAVFWDTHEKVKLEFDKKGISIPYPQRDVHLHQATA